ncbi:uncharacterized protein LOC115308935 [Ixodes scapularis]|uniref:uncharacterized protein LOC115308935 n=1 Tax=Ixodes scapularis TaxID=6945 RepID=UPI0011615A9F|nr:uncharacterized protein LOC115308935 [Ixodes scapularis]
MANSKPKKRGLWLKATWQREERRNVLRKWHAPYHRMIFEQSVDTGVLPSDRKISKDATKAAPKGKENREHLKCQ